MTPTATSAGPPEPVLNRVVPHRPWRRPRAHDLPGVAPISEDDWLWVLDSYAAQMAVREDLIDRRPNAVHRLLPGALPAARELLDRVLAQLDGIPGFRREGNRAICPDGRGVTLDLDAPLLTLGRLVQEDFCLLERPAPGEFHRLTGAILCFPASWTLAEKIGRPMAAVHAPVDVYDDALARRVQRLLDGLRPGRPLARCNALFYDDPALFQPRAESDPRPVGGAEAPFFRSERQCLLRLPETGAIAFSIHTIQMRRADLDAADLRALDNTPEKARAGARSSP